MFKKIGLVTFVTTLFVSLQANAGFREALSALQHKDAELMLTEVEKAVKAKSYDGLSLFVSTLDDRYQREDFVPENIKKNRLRRDYRLPEGYENEFIRWDAFLSITQQAHLINLLENIKSFDFPESQSIVQIISANLKKQKLADKELKAFKDDQYYKKKSAKIELRGLIKQKLEPKEANPAIEFYSSSPGYSLEIFSDGLVRYSAGKTSHHYNRDVAKIVGRDEWRISAFEVQALYDDLSSIGIYKMSKHYVTPILCDTGEASTSNMLNVHSGNQSKNISFQGWVNLKKEERIELILIRNVLEKHIPTLVLRCGENTLDLGYSSCYQSDVSDEKKASRWIKEQNNHVH